MANYQCIAAAALSLQRLIEASFEENDPLSGSTVTPRVVLIRTEDLEAVGSNGSLIQPPALSIFLYRVAANAATRADMPAVGSVGGRPHLPLDLHFLLTAWAQNAEFEQRILGQAMQSLEEHPRLSGPLLIESADWGQGDSIQVVMEEIPTETLMRIFDSLPHAYKLSVSYVARVVRLDRPEASVPKVSTSVLGIRPPPGE